MKCQASSYCKKYNSDNCNKFCGVYNLLQAVYKLTNIPLRYQYNIDLYPESIDLENYKLLQKFQQEIVSNVNQGKGLYIWSINTGNGKTTWASKIANHYIRKIVGQGRLDRVVTYINVPTYLERIRQSFNDEDLGLAELNNYVLESDLVVFDDIGAERPSEWVQERLYTIINHRYTNQKSSIYTSNVDPETLRVNLGERNYSRVVKSNTVIELKGGDRR